MALNDKARLAIRAHHLLCVLGFRGKGYSREFVENMGEVVQRLQSHPEDYIVIEDCPDDICQACPHNTDEGCTRAEGGEAGVRDRDHALLQRLGLAPKTEIAVASVYDGIKKHVTRDFMHRHVCRACEWEALGHCREGLDELRASPDA